MVWAGIMINGRTRLNVVVNGIMTGQRFIDEVLLPHLRLFRGAVGDKFVFMDDNATYLNPIENVWDALGRQVAGRNYLPTNKNTLIRALTEEWDKLPQQLLDNVVQTNGSTALLPVYINYSLLKLKTDVDIAISQLSIVDGEMAALESSQFSARVIASLTAMSLSCKFLLGSIIVQHSVSYLQLLGLVLIVSCMQEFCKEFGLMSVFTSNQS
ncbi:transposable element Tc1 transposase [Trichonephila clavipes]|nr:transposable element Tc1 transposase [Trichonephila clavipes]